MFQENQEVQVVNTGTEHDGKIWRIVGKAPNKEFTLPCGQKHASPESDDAWIVLLDKAISVPIELAEGVVTRQFKNNYAVCDSKYLKAVQ